uniref:Uncharacterized protein n=1 Tax=Arundo donax TaxID=35708 RepID=A0A0A9BK01_ARUDO
MFFFKVSGRSSSLSPASTRCVDDFCCFYPFPATSNQYEAHTYEHINIHVDHGWLFRCSKDYLGEWKLS